MLALMILLLLPCASIAADIPVSNMTLRKSQERLTYLSESIEKDLRISPLPQKKELEADKKKLRELNGTLTEAELDRVKMERSFTAYKLGPYFIGDFIYNGVDAYESKLAAFLLSSVEDVFRVSIRMKLRFKRERPQNLEGLHLEAPASPSYPSAQAAVAFYLADLLSEFAPCLQEEFRKSAEEIATRRIKAGVNYPSDVAAARVLAKETGRLFRKSPEWKKAFEEARAYWKGHFRTCDK